jgi:hypothetical protein
MEELTRRLAELSIDDDIELAWGIELSSVNTVVHAATKELHADEEAAWEAARVLWQAILDLGFGLTDEGVSEIGAISRPDADNGAQGWRGKVRMVLNPM